MHFFTRNNQLTLRITETGKLQFCYLGPRLNCPDDALTAPAAEWPLLATDFDSRGQWGNHSGEYALHLRYADGTQACNLLLQEQVVTENGAVNLYGKTLQERAKLIISIADPSAQEELDKAAFERFGSHFHFVTK